MYEFTTCLAGMSDLSTFWSCMASPCLVVRHWWLGRKKRTYHARQVRGTVDGFRRYAPAGQVCRQEAAKIEGKVDRTQVYLLSCGILWFCAASGSLHGHRGAPVEDSCWSFLQPAYLFIRLWWSWIPCADSSIPVLNGTLLADLGGDGTIPTTIEDSEQYRLCRWASACALCITLVVCAHSYPTMSTPLVHLWAWLKCSLIRRSSWTRARLHGTMLLASCDRVLVLALLASRHVRPFSFKQGIPTSL